MASGSISWGGLTPEYVRVVQETARPNIKFRFISWTQHRPEGGTVETGPEVVLLSGAVLTVTLNVTVDRRVDIKGRDLEPAPGTKESQIKLQECKAGRAGPPRRGEGGAARSALGGLDRRTVGRDSGRHPTAATGPPRPGFIRVRTTACLSPRGPPPGAVTVRRAGPGCVPAPRRTVW